jgi:WhiB family redox-sensing transcriptional regulator
MDPQVFHPTEDDEVGAERALAICVGCPVREPCLELAITTKETDGIWGGRTALERRRLVRSRRKAA